MLHESIRQASRFVFNGDPLSPLLAPRGVFMHENTLVVSDTGQNRICIWHNWQAQKHQPIDVVLGQPAVGDTARNNGMTATASSLQYPSGVWTNGQILIVADAWNHRVLIWHRFPQQHGTPADVVVGQPDFHSSLPNIKGLSHAPGSKSLYWPYGVWSNGKELWIADTGNRRILYFENIPVDNNTAATSVIGQLTMHEKEYNPDYAVWPYSVKVDDSGAMLVADTQYYRVLYWSQWSDALQQPASLILGQSNLGDNGQNQFGLTPQAHTLNWCYDACFAEGGVAVADTGNSRILGWDTLPAQSGAAAHWLLGQPGFTVNGESALSMKTNAVTEMYWPFAVNYIHQTLVLADTGNHCILFYKIPGA